MKALIDPVTGRREGTVFEPADFPRPTPEALAREEAEIDAEAERLSSLPEAQKASPSTWLD